MAAKLRRKHVSKVSELLSLVDEWHQTYSTNQPRRFGNVWYRGHADCAYELKPGAYRKKFLASNHTWGRGLDEKSLNLERTLLGEFRRSGVSLFNDHSELPEMYFIAQHHGLPTRLLDWTTNPLAGLFFSVNQNDDKDGELFVMDAKKVITPAPSPEPKDYPRNIMSMRHPYVRDAIRIAFWDQPRDVNRPKLILPVRPDAIPGRISQQSSCFTLHTSAQQDLTQNDTLESYIVPKGRKPELLEELRRLNITWFTVFCDLDSLSKELKQVYGL
jgi:hypothetical protein